MEFITDIENIMKNIEYGWVDKTGQRHTEFDEFGQKYMLQLPDQLQKSQLGVCWDQVELERKLFAERSIPFETYFIVYYDGDKCPTHTFLIFHKDGDAYWYEHSWAPMRGLHQYKSPASALKDIRDKFIDNELGGQYDVKNLFIYEYDAPNKNLSCPEFYKHCENGKRINISSI